MSDIDVLESWWEYDDKAEKILEKISEDLQKENLWDDNSLWLLKEYPIVMENTRWWYLGLRKKRWKMVTILNNMFNDNKQLIL